MKYFLKTHRTWNRTEKLRSNKYKTMLSSHYPVSVEIMTGARGEGPATNEGDMRHRFHPWVRKIPWRRKWQSAPVLLPGKSHGRRSLVGYSPWGRRVGHDWATERLHFHYHFQCFPSGSKVKNPPANARDIRDAGWIPASGRCPGRRNDNPLWYSCLENPMDRGAWWAAVHRVTESQTWLKRLSGSHEVAPKFCSRM